jgi:hypothetical protein
MAQTIELYGKALANLLGGETAGETFAVDFLSDTIKCSLHTSSYVPNLDTHELQTDLTNEVSGTGYTTGGATLGTKTITYTPANSFSPIWAASTAYNVGDVVRPTTGNGHLYRCVVAGTSHTVEPTWITVAQRETSEGSGTVKWTEVGRGVLVIDSADISWVSSTITARWGVVYKSTGTGATSPLLALIDFDTAGVSTTNGTLLITLPTLGIWQSFCVHRGVTP